MYESVRLRWNVRARPSFAYRDCASGFDAVANCGPGKFRASAVIRHTSVDEVDVPPMTGSLDYLRQRLSVCRQAAVQAAQEAARVRDEAARNSFALLAAGWNDLADDIERALNGDRDR
jgi:hypothetical protein